MKIIIIGGTAAGTSAAAKAKRTNKELSITIYEKTNITSFGTCGLPYFIGGFFDEPNNMIARTSDEFAQNGISVFTEHEVIKVDTKNNTIKIKNLKTKQIFNDTYDKLVIATGANPIIPPISNIQLNNFYTVKNMQDGKELRALFEKKTINDIVIIGAGYIGIEMVEAAKALGKNVRIIQLDKRILIESFDKEITNIMEEELKSNNVLIHTNEFAKSLIGKEKVKGIITNKAEYKADLIILSTGVRPATEFLEDQLEMLPNGAIIVNEYGETSVKNIFAAGDCATIYNIVSKKNDYIPLATTANKLGKVIGENLAGRRVSFKGTLGSASIKVLSLEAARTGLTEEAALKLGIKYQTVFIKDKNHTNYYPNQEDLYIKLIYNEKTKEIIGAQIIGKNGAAIRMHALSLAIYSRLTTKELGMMDFSYSPPFSKTWDALNVAGNAAK
ncbi:CoA-disulfide reductase [Borrelia miyamotoi]|uniref:CoA-disulfide reductase n=1 Tax=Borrelia miyamotoi TaxID=47466 RepID=A0AAQ2WUP5_9SPIR|nr:CoA-disulfide reductase [Borrelia miyamotoi]AGT27672.1 CoA disulfide reductase [Borrelia miyamotoi LB-2001]AJA58831.1 CoA-disulfide reductase [Borrelia miyamotoi]AOW95916.1 CoA-disulfide reductase [Borrelia miyamotoi]QTL83807.1 CoA-disulfide reductase [Borrelia miyamotoi]WAZ84886.1 CoA-disulfide reductase [Borrelia miyamotoi]